MADPIRARDGATGDDFGTLEVAETVLGTLTTPERLVVECPCGEWHRYDRREQCEQWPKPAKKVRRKLKRA